MSTEKNEQQPEPGAAQPMPPEPDIKPAARSFTRDGESLLPPDYESKHELAHRLGVSVRWVDSAIATRALPFVRLGKKLIRFRRSEVDSHLARHHRVAARAEY